MLILCSWNRQGIGCEGKELDRERDRQQLETAGGGRRSTSFLKIFGEYNTSLSLAAQSNFSRFTSGQ